MVMWALRVTRLPSPSVYAMRAQHAQYMFTFVAGVEQHVL